MNCKIIVCALTFICTLTTVYTIHIGDPRELCHDMMPRHSGIQGQVVPMPYKLFVDRNKAKSGDTIKITIRAYGGISFQGFFLQMRQGKFSEPIGKFLVLPSNKDIKTVECIPGLPNAVTDQNIHEKTEIVVNWLVPEGIIGEVQVYATILKDFAMFWVAQPGPQIQVK